ncbi:ABC transporter substrate-binding protein [Desulfomicrobium escambiense]|uniref:ABC transporter substrate-binding protein n=1 Tax=Desulfomicrobium escambiense TaxID=29503 RepID=UPI0003FF81BC|nr:ABC transporter substrate binding protein [Desulfomicrobium escambiense]
MYCNVIFALLLLLASVVPPAAADGGFPGRRVLVVHSYDRGFAWTADIDDALQRELLPRQVQIRTFFMDTNLRPREADIIAAGRKATDIMLEFRPDVVIVSDDNAQKYFAAQYAGNASAPSFVFCGVNKAPSTYGYPAINVTGVVENLAWAKGLELLRRLKPSIKKIAVLRDTRPSSQAEADKMKSSGPDDIEVSWFAVDSFEEWQARVRTAGSDYDALAVMTYNNLTDAEGHIVPAEQVMLWTRDNAALPTLGFYDYTVADGTLCGVIQTGFEHGTLAASLALRILGGERAGDIPVITQTRGLIMLNSLTARKLGIEIPHRLSQEAAALVE